MNTDIRISVSFKGHRKLRKLRRAIGDRAAEHLINLWISAATDAPKGVLAGWTDEDISDAADWQGEPSDFTAALINCAFLERDANGSYVLHDWCHWQGWACEAEDRSDRARFHKLKQAYPSLHKSMYDSGVRSISQCAYQEEVRKYLTSIADSSGDREPVSSVQPANSQPIASQQLANSQPIASSLPILSLPILSTDKQLPPLPPAGGSEESKEGKEGGNQPTHPQHTDVSQEGQPEKPKRKGKPKELPAFSEKFLAFWSAYPNKNGKAEAWIKWHEWKLDSQFEAIMAALSSFKRTKDWLKDNGDFIPHGSTWVRQRKWLDMAEVAAPKQPAQRNDSSVNIDEIIRKAIEAKRIETCGSDAL